ncbi:response regulator [Cohnella sp. AR92]|uniref:response regulator transcription factor n=1 Tax=Cohnella sp. AR92 TaxID=648716 RepID=UPI000F8DA335|nr:response regulator [Cohnella sp. AR92]RUS47831.1 response regulator [Cohnella sp. AR92]
MKVLLVDDEQHVREAIKLLVDWETLGIRKIVEADNGEEAMRIIEREKPEIVITDMRMPIRDGVDLLAWMEEQDCPARRIVVSGHDDFHLVRSTMKYGGQDYLLKPVDPDQLQEALGKAVASWEQENKERRLTQKRNIEMNQLKPVYWDKIFSNLVSEPGSYAFVRETLEEEFRLDRARQAQVVILSMDTIGRSVTDKYSRNRDLLFFTVTNICNEFLRPDNRGFACRFWSSEQEVILVLWDRLSQTKDTLARIQQGFQSTLKCRFDLGIGTVEAFPNGLASSYSAARAALKHRNLLARVSWCHEYDPSERTAASKLNLFDFEESFRMAVLSGNESEIGIVVDRWLGEVGRLPVVTMEQMELWRHEFHAMLERWSGDGAAGSEETGTKAAASAGTAAAAMPAQTIPLTEEGAISLEQWRRDWTERLVRLAAKQNSERGRERNVMLEIAKYIEQNYNRELTLQDIASQFYLSREYISRRFKQEFGENLSDFLGRIRIDKAKLLLGNPQLRIADIAEMVGYADEKYFSKVFKKLEGVSPNQYRKPFMR